ncbi:lung seven transmembrane receptor-domain-containing protein, partial [Syncephalastrum racemosum]
SAVIYEWRDRDKMGMVVDGQREYICSDTAIRQGLCDASERGQFLVQVPPAERSTKSPPILSLALDVHPNTPEIALYKVDQTGFYCVHLAPVPNTNGNVTTFDTWVEWRFPYGLLPAIDYPKLLFYGLFSIVYLAVGIWWGVQTFRFWGDILPVQHFLSGTIFYLTVEMAFNWGFWEAYNQKGSPCKFFEEVGARNGRTADFMSFFMLLIVCMGYSVVRPDLGGKMKLCIILACTHFFFGVIYTLGTMLLSPESAGWMMLFVIFPLSITMTLFYLWTLNSITATLALLDRKRQHVKALMYKRLYRLLVSSVVMVVVIFIINVFNFSDHTADDWAARNWKWRWFILDGMLNLVYFAVFMTIVVLWRPTDNNARYGLMQLSQDEEEAMDLDTQLHDDDDDDDDARPPSYSRRPREGHDAAIFDLGHDSEDEDDGHVRLKGVNGHSKDSKAQHSPGPSHVDDEDQGEQSAFLR